MKYKITRTHLEPLKRKWQLKSLLSAEFINGGFDDNGNLFSMTFPCFVEKRILKNIKSPIRKNNNILP